MTDLKSCPFCGGEAHTYKNNLWHVGCEHAHNNCVTMSAFVTEAEAIAAWNARAERTCRAKPHLNLTVGDDFLTQSGWSCSECGGRLDLPVKAYYCPNCGRKVVCDD